MEEKRTAFDRYPGDYDEWFDRHPAIYQAEISALQQAVPRDKTGIEIGVGTGRFAGPLNIEFGVEPSKAMAEIAEKRGIKVYRGRAEKLPVERGSFDFVLMVNTVCFLSDIPLAFAEAHRILKPRGEVILAIIDRNSELGRKYEKKKSIHKFYQDAHFLTTGEITDLLVKAGFENFQYWQTLIGQCADKPERPFPGYGRGSFVVIKAIKRTNG